MSDMPQFVEWTHEGPLPAVLPSTAMIFGGTSLLPRFIEHVAGSDGGELVIASPYFFAPSAQLERVWDTMTHGFIDLSVKVRTRVDATRAMRFLSRYPWKSVRISTQSNLHAKVYTFLARNRESGACLIGSHNLTPAACRTNREAGLLFIGNGSPDALCVINAARSYVLEETGCDAAPILDSYSPFTRPEAA